MVVPVGMGVFRCAINVTFDCTMLKKTRTGVSGVALRFWESANFLKFRLPHDSAVAITIHECKNLTIGGKKNDA